MGVGGLVWNQEEVFNRTFEIVRYWKLSEPFWGGPSAQNWISEYYRARMKFVASELPPTGWLPQCYTGEINGSILEAFQQNNITTRWVMKKWLGIDEVIITYLFMCCGYQVVLAWWRLITKDWSYIYALMNEWWLPSGYYMSVTIAIDELWAFSRLPDHDHRRAMSIQLFIRKE